ncbi:MAG: hypothetical protein RIT81_14530 [Deltaproteobacteria bacterium]
MSTIQTRPAPLRSTNVETSFVTQGDFADAGDAISTNHSESVSALSIAPHKSGEASRFAWSRKIRIVCRLNSPPAKDSNAA